MRGNITTKAAHIKRIIRKYQEQLYVNNLTTDENNKLLEKIAETTKVHLKKK